eukprot:11437935-Karenia_brevis.AAC.1
MRQRNTNPIGCEADEAAGPSLLVVKRSTSKESLEQPAMQGVSGSADDFVRGSASSGGSNLITKRKKGVVKLLQEFC